MRRMALGEEKISRSRINLLITGRSDRDSNSGYAFDVYTLSRRASSATRASLLAHLRLQR